MKEQVEFEKKLHQFITCIYFEFHINIIRYCNLMIYPKKFDIESGEIIHTCACVPLL